jgi:hypothetical protein
MPSPSNFRLILLVLVCLEKKLPNPDSAMVMHEQVPAMGPSQALVMNPVDFLVSTC